MLLCTEIRCTIIIATKGVLEEEEEEEVVVVVVVLVVLVVELPLLDLFFDVVSLAPNCGKPRNPKVLKVP